MISDFEIDCLLQIDLAAVLAAGDPLSWEYTLTTEKWRKRCIERYGFTYSLLQVNRGAYEEPDLHVRLQDVAADPEPYLRYCLDPDEVNSFQDCQLVQGFGILDGEDVMVCMMTDTGICYHLIWHYCVAWDVISKGKTDPMDINTFCAEMLDKESIKIEFDPLLANASAGNPSNRVFYLSRSRYEEQMMAVVQPIDRTFAMLNNELSERLVRQASRKILDDVFPPNFAERLGKVIGKSA